MSSIADDVLVLSIRPDGKWLGGGLGPDTALGVAALADLVNTGALTLDGDRVADINTGLLPARYAKHVTHGATMSDIAWKLGPEAKKEGLEKLEWRGIIKVRRKRLLGLIPSLRITVNNQTPREEALARLREVEGDPTKVHDEVAILAGILHAANLLTHVLNRPASECQTLIDCLQAAGPTADTVNEVNDSLTQVRITIAAAGFATVIAPTLLGT